MNTREEAARLRAEYELARLQAEDEVARLERELEETRVRKEQELEVLEAREAVAHRRAAEAAARLRDEEDVRRSRMTRTVVESEPARRTRRAAPTRRYYDEPAYAPESREVPARAVDETARLLRGLSAAYVHQIRLAADIAGSFADALLERGQEAAGRAVEEAPTRSGRSRLTTRTRSSIRSPREPVAVARDVSATFWDALDDAIEIPQRTVDHFYQTYNET